MNVSEDSSKWKPSTEMIYPHFKNGLYLEEYFSKYYHEHESKFELAGWRYIDIFWTNLYCNKMFYNVSYSQTEIQEYIDNVYPTNANMQYFTIVQFDDGVLQKLPKGTVVFSAGGVGDLPLPLIYEDITNSLSSFPKLKFAEKSLVCSFVGRLTHKIRETIYNQFKDDPKYVFYIGFDTNIFKDLTVKSKFAFAPRGYGRSSFRFWEVYLLGTIPVYIYDDIKWLPYQDIINYSKIAVVLREDELDQLDRILMRYVNNVDLYQEMWDEYAKVAKYFTLEGMCDRIYDHVRTSKA